MPTWFTGAFVSVRIARPRPSGRGTATGPRSPRVATASSSVSAASGIARTLRGRDRRWKLIGLAGLAGVAATGVVVARKRREHVEYDADELRDRLHHRLAEVPANGNGAGPAAGVSAPGS